MADLIDRAGRALAARAGQLTYGREADVKSRVSWSASDRRRWITRIPDSFGGRELGFGLNVRVSTRGSSSRHWGTDDGWHFDWHIRVVVVEVVAGLRTYTLRWYYTDRRKSRREWKAPRQRQVERAVARG